MTLRPIYYDTETTGIKAESDHIIEIAAYDAFNGRSFCKFINPQIPIPPETIAIHHITDEMVKDAPEFKTIGREFIDFLGEDFVLIAHNNDAFDRPFLEAAYKRAGMKIPSWKYIDSLKWARKYRKDLPRHTLQYLREIYEVPANQAHRALDDVMVLYRVFSQMIDDLSMETVMELLSGKKSLERMPFGKYQGKELKKVPQNYVAWLAKNNVFEKKENEELKSAFMKLGLLKGAHL